jgi:hypothetical protein
MGRRGVISSFKCFYLSSLHVEEGRRGSASCALNSDISSSRGRETKKGEKKHLPDTFTHTILG